MYQSYQYVLYKIGMSNCKSALLHAQPRTLANPRSGMFHVPLTCRAFSLRLDFLLFKSCLIYLYWYRIEIRCKWRNLKYASQEIKWFFIAPGCFWWKHHKATNTKVVTTSLQVYVQTWIISIPPSKLFLAPNGSNAFHTLTVKRGVQQAK